MADIQFQSTESTPNFDEYKKKFAKHLIMERKNGILLVRMHTDGGPLKWWPQVHHMLLEAWRKRLYSEIPVPPRWHRDYTRGRTTTEGFGEIPPGLW